MRKLLRRIVPISQKDKKRILGVSQDILELREEQVSLLKSPLDLVKLVSGLTLLGTGGYRAWEVYEDVEDELEQDHKMKIGAWVAVSVLGLCSTLLGVCCTAAKSRVVPARKIVDEIKKTVVQ